MGIAVSDDVGDVVNRLGEPALPDHIGPGVLLLGMKELGGCHSRREDALFGNIEALSFETVGKVTWRQCGVLVRTRYSAPRSLEPFQEPVGPRNHGPSADEDAVHINEVVFGWRHA